MGWILKLITGNPLTLIYLVLGIAVAAGGAGGTIAWKVQGWRLDSAKSHLQTLQASYNSFKAQVRAEGQKAQQAAKQAENEAIQRAKESDSENKRTIALLNQRISSLRYDADHSGRYSMPPSPEGSKRPDLICFDRPEFSAAGGGLLGSLRQIADEGDKATIDLDSAKKWATKH